MELRVTVRFGDLDPPTGVVIGEDGTEVAFDGWLGMLQATVELSKEAAIRGTTKEVRS